jgi:uncharacterized protein (DUF4415 family)
LEDWAERFLPLFTPSGRKKSESSVQGGPDPMKKEHIVRVTFEEVLASPGRMNWAKIDATTEEDIERHAKEDEEEFGLGEIDWSKAVWVEPPAKKPISIRLDADILDFFKSHGSGYQSRINQVLRHYMESVEKKAD